VHYKNVYIIKLTCGTYSAGPLKLRRLYRYFRLIGEDGSTLDIKPVLEKLPMESREDDVILVNDSSDVLQPCTWIENISHHQYLINLLDAANYGSGARTVDDLKYSLASPVVAIWGKLPGFNYPKKVTAMCVDTSTSPETVWLGVEDELWKVTEKSQAEFVDRLDPYVRASDSKSFRLEIRRLVIDGAGYLQGMAWKSYFDQPKEGRDYDEYGFAFRTPAVVFRSTSLTAITEQNKIDSSGDSIFTSQEVFFRLGQLLGSYVYLGQYSSAATGVGGENLTLPFHQRVWFAYPSLGVVLENRSSLTDDTEQSTGVFFDHRELAPGHYALKASHADPTFFIGCCFTFGQPGFVVWDENQDKWAFLKWDGTNFYISYINYAGTITDYFDLSDTAKQVTCGCYYDGYVYLAVMECYYSGATFPGDYLDCKLERFDSGGSGKSTLFSFDSDSVEADQSLASGNEKYCTIIDMIYNENEDVIYGCLIDRSTLEYHVFAYDVSNDKLYTSQTGTGFTFDAGRQFKNFTYNSDDNTVYAVCADKRYKDSVAFLVTCEFTAPVGSPDGSEITLTYISNIMVGETDNVLMAMGGDGRIYGLTSEYNYIWQYDDVFYPRILLTDTGDDNIREVMTSISQVLNRVVNIRADRKVRFVTRDNYDGTKSLYEDTHITEMPPLQNWEHYYDMVEVSWNDPFTGHSGKESAGSGGWGRRVLSIENKLIQNQHLAALVASELHSFFNTRRKVISPVLIALIQLEEYDRVKCIMNSANVDVDRSDYYKLTAIDFDAENLVMEVRGVS